MSFDAGSIVATLELDRDPFLAGLELAQAEGEAFEGRVYRAKATVVDDGASSTLSTLTAEGDAFGEHDFVAKATVDSSDALAGIAAIKAATDAAIRGDAAAIDALATARTSVGAAALAQLFTSPDPVDPAVIQALQTARTTQGASAIAASLGLDAAAQLAQQVTQSDLASTASISRLILAGRSVEASTARMLDGHQRLLDQIAATDQDIVASETIARMAAAGTLGRAFGTGGGGGDDNGGGGSGIWSAFTGGGSGLPFLGATAAFGSIGSLLGFGAEHVIAMAIGTIGSMLGGIIGGGLLGLGALGVGGVGMGTDLAGIGQAAGDIKNVYGPLTALQSAVANYGGASVQAAQAQDQLNAALDGFSPVAQSAVLNAANTASQFKSLFDQVSGQAEALGAGIIQQAIQVGETFLPTIGKYATQNMSTIQNALQPLFAWLQDPSRWGGLGVFNNLEQLFQRSLPYAMGALTNGFELLGKTIDVAGQYGGQFILWVDQFVTKMNTTDFSKWSSWVQNMIGLFQSWFGLLASIGKTIFDVFMPAVGAGKALADFLTGLFHQIDTWLTSGSMQNALRDLFSVHLVELFQGLGGIVQGVLPLLEGFAEAFIRISTAGAGLATAVLLPIGDALKLFSHIPDISGLVGWGGALIVAGLAVKSFGGALLTFGQAGFMFARDTLQWTFGASGSLRMLLQTFRDTETGALSLGGILGAAGPFAIFAGVVAAASVLYVHSLDDMKSAEQQFANQSGLTKALAMPTGTNSITDLQAKYDGLTASISHLGSIVRDVHSADAMGAVALDMQKAANAANAAHQQIVNLNDNLNFLQIHFGISRQAAEQLATAAGVNLVKSLGDGSQAITQINQYLDQTGLSATETAASMVSMAQNSAGGLQSLQSLMQQVAQAQDQMTSNWASFTDPVSGITTFMQNATNQANAATSAQQAQASAAQGITQAQAQLASSQQQLAAAQQQYQADLASNSTNSASQIANDQAQIANAQANLVQAQGSVASAYQSQQQAAQQAAQAQVSYTNGIANNLIPTGAQITGWYTQQVSQAEAWTSNLQKALQDGYSPTVIAQIISQGPATAGPILQGLVSNYSQTMVGLVNTATSTLSQLGQAAIYQARDMQVVVNAQAQAVPQLVSDFNSAVAIQTTLTKNASAQTISEFTSSFSGGLPGLLAIANEYSIALPSNVTSQLGITGQAGNFQAGAFTGALGSTTNKGNATTAGTNLANSATNALGSQTAINNATTAGTNIGAAYGAAIGAAAQSFFTKAFWNIAAMAQSNTLGQYANIPTGSSPLPNTASGSTGDASNSPTFGYPAVPKLAAGGFVANPLLAVVAESGPELVLPLTDPARMSALMGALLGTHLTGSVTGLPPGGGSGFVHALQGLLGGSPYPGVTTAPSGTAVTSDALSPSAIAAALAPQTTSNGPTSITNQFKVTVSAGSNADPGQIAHAVTAALETYSEELAHMALAGQRPRAG